MSLLPLAACGGSGGGSAAPTAASPPSVILPAPDPDFIENPTNVFIARDDVARTLSEGENSSNLTVTGGAGSDSITTGTGADNITGGAGNDTIISNNGNDSIKGGSGNDTIISGNGNDLIRGGEGRDGINAGAGNDAIVVVGTTSAGQYDNSDIINPAGSGQNLSDLITLADLNGRTVSEVTFGEVINGGSGANTLYIYGTVDLTGVTISNVTVLVVNSDVTLTLGQLALFTTVDGDGSSVVNIEIPLGSADNYILDLSAMSLSDILSINIDGDITLKIDDATDLSGIGEITSGTSDELTLIISGNGGATTNKLSDIANVIDKIATIELDDNVILEISVPDNITDLGLGKISGTGVIDAGGDTTVEDALDDIDVDPTLYPALPLIRIGNISTSETDETDTFSVSLSVASDKVITVDYDAPDGTKGTLIFNVGETEQTFITVWSDDILDENDEIVVATLSNPSNATIADDSGTLTIIDDDNAPLISIDNISANEADETDTFTVSLSVASGKVITVDYDAPDGTTGTLTFNAGETEQTFITAWTDDAVDEVDEIVVATLSNSSNAAIADGSGTLTIIDDDIPVETPISDDLFTAILAMDAANRGYYQSINLSGNQIGRATIIENSSVLIASDEDVSFFAQAYSYDGGVTISYRGTDDQLIDEVTGWPLGAGDGNSIQGLMALDFYQYIFNTISTNIDLTGNSMGGGLAGFVGSIQNQDAVIFNSMAYYQGAVDFLNPVLPNQFVVSGYRVSGEWLEFEPDAPDLIGVEIDHGNTFNNVELHDLSTLIIALYMDEQDSNGSWRAAEEYFWPVLYDDSSSFAERTGTNDNSLDGFLQDSGYNGSILKSIIAYSTINEGTRIFGDTAIRSFYNDANNLGAALTASGQGSYIREFAQDISYTFTHMAGRLGLNKILQTDDQGSLALDGILTYSTTGLNNTLTIELSDAHWDLLTGVTTHNADLSRQELISEIIGTNNDVLEQADYLWGDGTYNAFSRVIFAVEGNSSSVISENNASSPGANYFIGDDTANQVTGSSTTDMIHTELGNDFIIASASNDAINGGDGMDTIDYSLLNQSVTVEISPDASFDFIINKDGSDVDGLNSIETIIGTDGNSDTINIDQSNILSLTNPEDGIYLLDLLNDGSPQIYRFEDFELFNTGIL